MAGKKLAQDKLLTRQTNPRRVFRYLCTAAALALSWLTWTWSPYTATKLHRAVDPAEQWQDNIFPYRNQTPWDISTDFDYPRLLEYDVEEGTWLRLDLHPESGDIVFDMVGDIYCIPGAEAIPGAEQPAKARPVLRGIPYDADPRFTPDGKRMVFRSDAGLGVENAWVMPWKGCEEMDLDALHRPDRLAREGRSLAQRITNETFRYVSNPRVHPNGQKVIASKWYISTVTIGASEGWEYDLPSDDNPEPNAGRRVLGRTPPPGADYGEVHVGPEQLVWWGEDRIIYAKNARVQYRYTDVNPDVHKGMYAIHSRNLTTGKEEILVDASPGGASRPELSRDGRTLAFVRRERDHEILVLKDLITGTLHHVWDGLNYDLTYSPSTPTGSYPSYAFTPNDDAVIIWASGQIFFVPLSTNYLSERTAHPTMKPQPIRFRAHIEKRLADTLKANNVDLVGLETGGKERVHALEELFVDEQGTHAVFQAAGVSVMHDLKTGKTRTVPKLDVEAPYYSPSIIPGTDWVIHARWDDTEFTSFEVADTATGKAYSVEGLPFGRYRLPTVSPQAGNGSRKVAFVKTAGDLLTGSVLATASPGLHIADIVLPPANGVVKLENIIYVPSDLLPDEASLKLRFEAPSRLLVQQADRAFTINLDGERDILGKPPHTALVTGRLSNQIVVSNELVAFLEYQHVYLAERRHLAPGEQVWAKPGNSTEGLARLSRHGAHDVTWSADGRRVVWLSGPVIHALDVSLLKECSTEITRDPLTFGIQCVDKLVERHEVVVEHSTDISRLREEEETGPSGGSLVIYNATVLTMDGTANEIISEALIVIKGGIIQSIAPIATAVLPSQATVIDAKGGFVVPGYIDMHAHWGGYTSRYPASSWEMQTFLAYGVTTIHNPSSSTVDTHIERNVIESGYHIGPRILTTGSVLFSGGWVGLHEEIVDMEQAYDALMRIKAEAGPVAISYKNYQLPSRASRQRLLTVARNLSLLCFPEGGGNDDWDLTYIIDGMTTLEHSFTKHVQYEDVITLFAASGSGYTPTHIVSYGGPWGEQLVWATEDTPNDPKLRRFVPDNVLLELTESYARPPHSYAIANISTSAAQMVSKGLKVLIGAHGESPKGLNYHAEMEFTKKGGLTNYQVLQAATVWAAETLGIDDSAGTISRGKLADLLIYPPGTELLHGPISETRKLAFVMRGGRLWETSTMEQVWPSRKAPPTMPPFSPD